MKNALLNTICITALGILSMQAMARGGAGGGGGGGGFSHGAAAGPSSSAAMDNANGRFAQDRSTGLDRAQSRMSDEGQAHEKATERMDPPADGAADTDKRTRRNRTSQ